MIDLRLYTSPIKNELPFCRHGYTVTVSPEVLAIRHAPRDLEQYLEFLEVVAKVHFLELILGFRRVVKLSPIPMPDDDAVLVAFIEHHTKISKGKSVPRYQDFRGDGPYIYWLCVCFCGFMWDKYSLAAYDRRKHTAGKKASSTVIREASFPNPVDRNISRSDKPGMQVVDLGTPPENPKNPWSSHDLHYIECDDVVDD